MVNRFREKKSKLKKQIEHLNGLLAEFFVIILLLSKKYLIIEWRYKSPCGEIDIIALDYKTKTIIFNEVKYREDFSYRFDIISISKQKRIYNSAELFLSSSYPKYARYFIRFDIYFVNRNFDVEIVENGISF